MPLKPLRFYPDFKFELSRADSRAVSETSPKELSGGPIYFISFLVLVK